MARQKLYSEQEIQNDVYDAVNGVLKVGSETPGSINISGTAAIVKKAFVDIAAAQTNATVVTAVTSKKIRVISAVLLAGATATTIQFTSDNANAITPNFQNGVNGGAVLPRNVDGWFETASGGALKATTGAGSTTSVLLNYIEV